MRALLGLRCRWTRPAAAVLGGALIAASTPAAAQTACAGSGWGQLNLVNYNFSYVSRVLGRGASASTLHCVRNNHAGRAVFVDWRDAGLRSAIPPGATIFRASPLAGRAASRRLSALFYGARPSLIAVVTLAGAAPPLPGPFGPAAPAALFRRAAFWQAAPAETPAAGNASRVYIPVDLAFLAEFVRHPLSPSRLIAWLEDNPQRLHPFEMAFGNRVTVDASGHVGIAYECRYLLPNIALTGGPNVYLRFSDATLHRLMFRRDDPWPVRGWDGREVVLGGALPPAAPGRVAARTARLEILLGDRRTVVAAIPVTYSAPAS